MPSSLPGEALREPAICDIIDRDMNDMDALWDSSFMQQDLLPPGLLDNTFLFYDNPLGSEPLRTSSFTHFASRLPSLNEDDADGDSHVEELAETLTMPCFISEAHYERIRFELQDYTTVFPPECTLPSSNSLSENLKMCLSCALKFLPIIHYPTFSIQAKDVELLLAMAALGALYRYEKAKAYEMYFMAKTILSEKTRRADIRRASEFMSGQAQSCPEKAKRLETIQTLVLLMTFASWADERFAQEALSMRSQLALLLTQFGISESDEMPPNVDWPLWATIEEKRRTLLAAYALLNLHIIAFNTPPLILNHEIGLYLPGSSKQWNAANSVQWHKAPRQVERQFQVALKCLFEGTGTPRNASLSAFSNYLLINGLLQHIYIDRQSSRGSLHPYTVEYFEIALRTWQKSWETTSECTLDPLAYKTPSGLSAVSLLRLAYIYLVQDRDQCGGLLSRGPRSKALSLDRSPCVDKAVLQAAHALSIPVRLGITYMSRTKTAIWSIEHSLCSLECATLLKDWLEMISTTVRLWGIEILRGVEKKLLGIITGIIKETSFAESLDLIEDDASRYQRMATNVVKIWAQIFQGVHVFEFDDTIRVRLQHLVETNPD